MSIHKSPHPLAGETVRLPKHGADFRLEDWWDRVSGGSWMTAEGNPAALQYALRSANARLPMDNEVVYGKIGGLGHIIHISELGEVVPQEEPESERPMVGLFHESLDEVAEKGNKRWWYITGASFGCMIVAAIPMLIFGVPGPIVRAGMLVAFLFGFVFSMKTVDAVIR